MGDFIILPSGCVITTYKTRGCLWRGGSSTGAEGIPLPVAARSQHMRGSNLLTFSRKVLGFGPLFLGPYSSISRSLEVLKKPKLQFSIATRQQHIYKSKGCSEQKALYLSSKAASRRASKMFSSGSQVLYLRRQHRERGKNKSN